MSCFAARRSSNCFNALFCCSEGADPYRGFDFLGRAVEITGGGFEPSLRQVTKYIVWRFRRYAFENLHRFGVALLRTEVGARASTFVQESPARPRDPKPFLLRPVCSSL